MNGLNKPCIVCGREIQCRKKWKENWQQVKYCSQACRKSGLRDTDINLEKIIMDLLHSGKTGGSIFASQAAKELVAGDDER